MGTNSTVDGSLIREGNSGGEGCGIWVVDIGGDVRGRLDGVIAGDVDRLDEGVEVSSGNVVGVVPVDHASSPLNCALGSSIDTSGPHTRVGGRCQFRSKREREKGVLPDLNTSGGSWVKSNAIRVDGIGLLQGADRVSVDQPRQSIRLPVDLEWSDLGGWFGGWDEMQTHGVVVVVAEGITKIPMFATIGLFGYRRG